MVVTVAVSFICTGNICRSPMAEVITRHLVASDPDLDGLVRVTSAGTANWHHGNPMDPRARDALNRAGYREPGSLARFADAAYLDSQDVIVVMTREHLSDVRQRRTGDHGDLLLLRDLLDGGRGLDVADPYYGDEHDFDACLQQISAGCHSLVQHLRDRTLPTSFAV